MKDLSKVLVIALFILLAIPTQAQVAFGLKAGLNAANFKSDYKDGDEPATKIRPLFHLGIIADIGFSDLLSLQTGLLYSAKGASIDLEDGLDPGMEIDGYSRLILNYIEIPAHLSVKFSGFQVYAGPYLAVLVGGKGKYDWTLKSDGQEIVSADGETKIKPVFGEADYNELAENEEGALKALDIGLDFGIGYMAGPVLINAGYSLGLANITPGDKSDPDFDPKDQKMTNRVISLSVTYFFGK